MAIRAMLLVATALALVASIATPSAAEAGKTTVETKLTIDSLTTENASGTVKAKGRNVPGRVLRRCQRKRQVIVFEEAGSQDLLASRTLTDGRGRWSAQPTQGEYLALPHHAIVVATVSRARKTGRRFKCRSATSTTVTPTPAALLAAETADRVERREGRGRS